MSDDGRAPAAPDPFTPEQRAELLELMAEAGCEDERAVRIVDQLARVVAWHRAERGVAVAPIVSPAKAIAQLEALSRALTAAAEASTSLPPSIVGVFVDEVTSENSGGVERPLSEGFEALERMGATIREFEQIVAKVLARARRELVPGRPGRRAERRVNELYAWIEFDLALTAKGRTEGFTKRIIELCLAAAGEDDDALERYLERRRKAASRRRTNPRD